MNNIEQGREHETSALVALASLGWLSTKQIGAWVYYESSPATQVRQAGRLLGRLESRGFILRRQNVRGATVWVLTEPGANRVRTDTDNRVPARAGYKLSTEGCNARHEYAIRHLTEARAKGKAAVGAAGLRAGWTEYGELPGLDGVVIDPMTNEAYGLVGVTNHHEENVERYRQLRQHLPIVLLGERWAVDEIEKLAAR